MEDIRTLNYGLTVDRSFFSRDLLRHRRQCRLSVYLTYVFVRTLIPSFETPEDNPVGERVCRRAQTRRRPLDR